MVQVKHAIKIEMLQPKPLFLKNMLWGYFSSMGWHYCFSKETQSTVLPSLGGLYGDIASLKQIKKTQMHSKNHKGPEKRDLTPVWCKHFTLHTHHYCCNTAWQFSVKKAPVLNWTMKGMCTTFISSRIIKHRTWLFQPSLTELLQCASQILHYFHKWRSTGWPARCVSLQTQHSQHQV